jgi:hypothetical protein
VLELTSSTHLQQVRVQCRRVSVDTHPDTIDEHLGRVRGAREFRLILQSPLFQELHDRSGIGPDRDVRHEGEVLDETTGCSFGRFGRTDHAPMRVVQLSRLGRLAATVDRGVGPPQVR